MVEDLTIHRTTSGHLPLSYTVGWQVLGSHLGTRSNPERVFRGPVDRYKATTASSLSL